MSTAGPPALVEPQGPPGRHGRAANDLLVLADDLLRGGAREEVQVQHATNDPAVQAVQGPQAVPITQAILLHIMVSLSQLMRLQCLRTVYCRAKDVSQALG